jgi:hypothetical protein
MDQLAKKKLSPNEQAGAIQRHRPRKLSGCHQLTGKWLSALTERMTNGSDPAEVALVREAIVRGFYGGEP